MNLNIENENDSKIIKINEHIRNKNPIVIYFYKDGCPYCIETTKEWNKIPIQNKQNLLVVKINKLLFHKINNIGEAAKTYPNIRYVHNHKVFHFKKEGIDRNAESLEKWINQIYSMTNKKVHFSEHNNKYHKILRNQTPFHNRVLHTKTYKNRHKKNNKTRHR